MERALMLVFLCFLAGCKHHTDNIPSKIDMMLPFTKNPSGNWQIGYSLHDNLSMADFRLCTYADSSNAINMWHPGTGSAGYYPYIGQNRTTTTQIDATNSWAAKPGEIVMEGSNSGQYAIVRFVVPATGQYKVKAIFEGVHSRLSTTDVHILLNDQHLLDDIIEGYGGDTILSEQKGAHPVTSWASSMQLKKGDILAFAIGYGSNKTFYNDTSGLLLSIEPE
jgi:hypothetical protein